MPKVRALGSDHMRACAAAKDAGKAAVLSPPDMRYRLKQLLCACHYERREQLEAALNLPAGRLAYYMDVHLYMSALGWGQTVARQKNSY